MLDDLRKSEHVVVAGGGGELVLSELAACIEPALKLLLAHRSSGPMMGEVTSSFGHEDADEAAEQLAEELREALLDSEGIEDVFADDKTLERALIRALARGVPVVAVRAELEAEDPRVEVRFASLGFVGAEAAKRADEATLRDVLERAAEELRVSFDGLEAASGRAFFVIDSEDSDLRLELEANIEEQLRDLVELGVVELPSVERVLSLGARFDRDARKGLRRTLDRLADEHLRHPECTGTWDWRGEESIALLLTPLSERGSALIDELSASFARGLRSQDLAAASAGSHPSAPQSSTARSDDGSEPGMNALLAALGSLSSKTRSLAEKPPSKAGATKSAPSKEAPSKSKSSRAKTSKSASNSSLSAKRPTKADATTETASSKKTARKAAPKASASSTEPDAPRAVRRKPGKRDGS